MATRGSIPKIMGVAGIDMLSPEAGIPIVRRELTAGAARGEIVIGQRLGVLMNEWDETGGIEPRQTLPAAEQKPMIVKVAGVSVFTPWSFEATLDPKIQPFLFDHQIDGTPVLDIKPVMREFQPKGEIGQPAWVAELMKEYWK